MNTKLAICITTYNRADILKDILLDLIPKAQRFDIPIFVSDNCSVDDTGDVLAAAKARYPYLFFNINEANMGFDINFERCVKMANTDYLWIMGDYSFIHDNALDVVLGYIKQDDYDIIMLNNYNRIKKIPTQIYTNSGDVLQTLGWHITVLDSMVWNKRVVENGRFERFYGTMFGYFGVAMEYLSGRTIRVLWEEKSLVSKAHPKKISLWAKNTIRVWVEQWITVVMALPCSYSTKSKLSLIRQHGIGSGIFTTKGLIRLRADGALSFTELYSRFSLLWIAMGSRALITFLLGGIPPGIINVLRKLKK